MLALLLPSLGVWIVSSLVAMEGGPQPWALAAGALCFPILPGLWAWLARRARGRPARFGGALDLALRTAGVNLLLLGALFALWPQRALVAVCTRGDWFLEEVHADWGGPARTAVLEVAEGVAWVHNRLAPNRFEQAQPGESPPPEAPVAGSVAVAPAATVPKSSPAPRSPAIQRPPASKTQPAPPPVSPPPRPGPPPGRQAVAPEPPLRPAIPKAASRDSEPGALVLSNVDGELRWREDGELPEAGLTVIDSGLTPPTSKVRPEPPQAPDPDAPKANSQVGLRWPLPGGPHPQAQSLPDSETRTVAGLAAQVRLRTSDPQDRLRLLHDWMALHIAYDDLAQFSDPPPSYEPELVLKRRAALCDGFARVFGAVAAQLGLRTAYVVGHTRAPQGDLSPLGHAWNAVQLQGAWYLVDVTWDATRWTSGKTQPYSTAYLLAPPEVFRISHMPNDQAWQLSAPPIGLAAFLRQPMSRPSLHANEVRIVQPQRPHLSVRGEVQVELDNPRRRFLSLTVEPKVSDGRKPGHRPCAEPTSDAQATLRCPVPRSGEHTLMLWVGTRPTGTQIAAARWSLVGL